MELNKLSKILVIRLSSLGDILLTTPVIRAIKKSNSNCQIDFLTKPAFSDVIKYNEHLTNTFSFDKTEDHNSLLEQLRSQNYDMVIDLQNNIRSRELCGKLNVTSLKFSKPNIQKFLLVNFKWNTYSNIKSIVEMYVSTLPGLKLDDDGLDFYSVDGKVLQKNNEEKSVGFCPGSKHFTKMWPKEYFVELGNTLSRHNYKIKLMGGSSDKQICEEITSQISGSINECSNDDICQTARSISECRYIVCNDSGLMHLAAAIQVPLFAIFGSTVKEFGFYPYKCTHHVFENAVVKCRPCSHIGKSKCPKKHFNCMLNIKPDQISDKILYLSNNE